MDKQEFYHIGGALGDADQAGQALERGGGQVLTHEARPEVLHEVTVDEDQLLQAGAAGGHQLERGHVQLVHMLEVEQLQLGPLVRHQPVHLVAVEVAGQQLQLPQLLQFGQWTQQVAEILVDVEVDVLDLRTEGDGEVELVEGHVPGVEMSDEQGGRLAPALGDVLHNLAEHVAPPDVGELVQPLQQLRVARHRLRGLEQVEGLQRRAEQQPGGAGLGDGARAADVEVPQLGTVLPDQRERLVLAVAPQREAGQLHQPLQGFEAVVSDGLAIARAETQDLEAGHLVQVAVDAVLEDLGHGGEVHDPDPGVDEQVDEPDEDMDPVHALGRGVGPPHRRLGHVHGLGEPGHQALHQALVAVPGYRCSGAE